ncbi:hypothetical protein J9978_21245 [Chromobacterium violaceum]|uniref:hypothetical protein n=1 Tax=Chromobacterium violaceum TaxID=536 RepID=UPI001B32490C|nr:hypothetical protein [Chromobacterium violaceum]MBP4052006.1 hypothetical protein [Chromobacterium violaceum]
MGQVKQNCHYVPTQNTMFRLTGVHPDWEMHPSWINAIESLDSYNLWVCEVVLPIAFQWIEEHKGDVYKNIPENFKDDVGVVIAEAFEIVKGMSAYKNGLVEQRKYDNSLANKKFTSKKTNPLWTDISKSIRNARLSSFNQHLPILKSSIK